jgi:hypothetical protein
MYDTRRIVTIPAIVTVIPLTYFEVLNYHVDSNGFWWCCITTLNITKFIRKCSFHSSMALQPFVGPWSLLQFRNLFYTVGMTPWRSDQPVARPSTYKQDNTNTINAHTDIHALSGIRTRHPSVRANEHSSCFRQRGHCDRLWLCPSSWILNTTFRKLVWFPSSGEGVRDTYSVGSVRKR